MAETNPETTNAPAEPQVFEEKQTWLQARVNNHPRAAKVLAVVTATAAVAGVVQFARTLKANKPHLNAAADHAKAGLDEVAASVSFPDPEA